MIWLVLFLFGFVAVVAAALILTFRGFERKEKKDERKDSRGDDG